MANALTTESWWRSVQRRFLEPTVQLGSPEERLEAGMLSGFILVIFVAASAMALYGGAPLERRYLTAGLAVVCLIGYTLRWTRYYWLMGWVAVLGVTVPPFGNTLLGLDPNDSLRWLVIALLTGGLWLSAREFRFLYFVLTALILALPLLVMVLSLEIEEIGYLRLGQPIIFLSLVSLLIITSITFRKQSKDRIEQQDRRRIVG